MAYGVATLASIVSVAFLAYAWLKILEHRVAKQEQAIEALIRDAADRKRELEEDLERWDGIHAAYVGQDLEEVSDKLIAAIEANANGEDVRGMLYDIHGDVVCILADITTEEE